MTQGMIARLFPTDVSVHVASPEMYRGLLFQEEEQIAAAFGPKRRAEFTAGRNAARAALAGIGAPASAILRGPQLAPLWPAGFVGSITHCNGFCCAVVARSSQVASLGLDAEESAPLDESLTELVCSPSELAHFRSLPTPRVANWAKLAFSAKEAFYKCYHPLTNNVLDFRDVSIRFSIVQTLDHGDFRIAFAADRASADPRKLEVLGAWTLDNERVYAGAISLRN